MSFYERIPTRKMWEAKLSEYEGECPICHSKTKLIEGRNGLFFGCTKWRETGCKGKTKPSKEVLKDLEQYSEYLMELEEIDEQYFYGICGLMDMYPDWDPDKIDLDDYLEIHGLD